MNGFTKKKWILVVLLGFLVIGPGVFFYKKSQTSRTDSIDATPLNAQTNNSDAPAQKTGSQNVAPSTATKIGTLTPGGSPIAQKGNLATTPQDLENAPGKCFEKTFNHEKIASHQSGEPCLHHNNLISLGEKNIAPKSICIKVNDRPVKHQAVKGHTDQVLIGPVAGPRAKITASFCTKDAICQHNCTIPKDEFLEAIGGDLGGEQAPIVKWDGTLNKDSNSVDSKIDQELGSFNRQIAGRAAKGSVNVFSGWNLSQTSESCESKTVARQGAH